MQQVAKIVKKLAKIVKQEEPAELRIDVKPLLKAAKENPLEDFDKESIDTRYHSTGQTILAFASLEKKTTLTTLLTCKDYFQQAYWAFVNGRNYHDGTLSGVLRENALKNGDPEKISFLVTTGTCEGSCEENIENSLTLIHEIETKHGFELTKLSYIGKIPMPTSSYSLKARVGEGTVWALTPSPRWFLASPLLSLYIMLIRSGVSYGEKMRKLGGEGYIKHLEDSYVDGAYGAIKDQYYFAKARKLYSRIFAQPVEEVFGVDLKKNYPENRQTPHQEGYHWMGTQDYTDTFPDWKKV